MQKGRSPLLETPPSVNIRWWLARYAIFGIHLYTIQFSLFGCLYSILPSLLRYVIVQRYAVFAATTVTMDLPPHCDRQTL